MEVPITELLDYENNVEWFRQYFHPNGLKCPTCRKGLDSAQTSELEVLWCKECRTILNLHTGTVFQGSQWTSMQVVLLMRGICKGETTRELASELRLSYKRC